MTRMFHRLLIVLKVSSLCHPVMLQKSERAIVF